MSWFDTLAGLISGIFKPATDLVDNLHTSTEEKLELKAKMMEIENTLLQEMIKFFTGVLDAQKEIILAELKGSWLQKNWRPLLMLAISTGVVNNMILVPYMNAIFGWSVEIEISSKLWDLLIYGVTGYVGGRSVEKVVETLKGKK